MTMATRAQPSPLEQLASLLDEQASRAKKRREQLPSLRAKMLATGIMLDEFARTSPVDPPPRRRGVEVVLAAPDEEWAQDVAARLRDALPNARVELVDMPKHRPETTLPTPFSVRCLVSDIHGRHADERVRAALEQADDLKVDHSKSLDLIVVSPRY